jgi:sugar lactone lactonase YvrE
VRLLAGSQESLAAPNGLALSEDEKTLYVASDTRGLIRINLENGRFEPLPHAAKIATTGIDGLARAGRSLFAVLNNPPSPEPPRIVRYDLDAAGTAIVGAEVLDEGNPRFSVPTTCAIAGGRLYVLATSHLDKLDGEKARAGAVLGDIVVLKYPLWPSPSR